MGAEPWKGKGGPGVSAGQCVWGVGAADKQGWGMTWFVL